MSSTVMSGDRSLLHAVTAGMPETASREFREAFERVVNSSRLRLNDDDQPMDVDQDPLEGAGVIFEAAGTRRSESMVDIDESSDEDEDDDIVLPMAGVNDGDAQNDRPPPVVPRTDSSVDVSKLLPRLSSLLDLDKLWETLSECLLELGHTPDHHHAVLVLQVCYCFITCFHYCSRDITIHFIVLFSPRWKLFSWCMHLLLRKKIKIRLQENPGKHNWHIFNKIFLLYLQFNPAPILE